MRTYISLFSSAGVGCYGFKLEDFECVATNELIERRLNIQKINNKCRYNSGYICGDITKDEIKNQIFSQIELWKEKENLNTIDVLMATPPCQGMSTANYKKKNETRRNSLVVEAIYMVKNIQPRIFVFENVKSFLKTYCIDKDEQQLSIGECIEKQLGETYNIYSKIVNFKDYGVPSSRPRTLVIGTLKSEINFSPLNIFPLKQKVITLKEAIGNLPSLKYGETSNDFYHSFRVYPSYMQDWIHDLKEGETAFNNIDEKKPYKIVNGVRQQLKSGHMGNKFRRMFWDQPAPCITTRNDQLASQTTIHPSDDRVLSIRELMRVMTIPDSFCWVKEENFCRENIDKSETLIRQSIGEAVPTEIIHQIAININTMLDFDDFINSKQMSNRTNNYYINSYIYEKNLTDTKKTGSFYTTQAVVFNTVKNFKTKKSKIRILEPSVGMGAFIPQFLRLVDDCENVEITCIDISKQCLKLLQKLILNLNLQNKFVFKYINDDFLLTKIDNHYDAIIANPPYFKMSASQKNIYRKSYHKVNDNIFCLFLKKFSNLADDVMVVIPKSFLMIPDCNDVREIYSSNYNIISIYDYGVSFFKNVFIEILSIHFSKNYNNNLYIYNYRENKGRYVEQKYIYQETMWMLYRDEWYDNYKKKLKLNVFNFYRDRQLTNKYLSISKKNIWIIRSKNLLDDGTLIHKDGYDRYINSLTGFELQKYFNKKCIIFTNFTYNTRATILPDNCSVNGSLCILFPKKKLDDIDLSLYSTKEFRKYYSIVKNKSKFTINVDSNTIYYIGVKNND